MKPSTDHSRRPETADQDRDLPTEPFLSDISQHVWRAKYRYQELDGVRDRTIRDTWRRVARAVASVEPDDREEWERRFYTILDGFKFLPGGRILAGAGTSRQVTLFNCFVMGTIQDSMDSIFENLKEAAITMQQGGGIGYDFSTLRPRGARAKGVGAIASGPVSFMHIWDSMCSTILSTGARRGAMMATLRCDHPDIEEFIDAKREPGKLRHFNLSVQVTDDFMAAVQSNADWPLLFPASELEGEGEISVRRWPGSDSEIACRVVRQTDARALWDRLMRAAYDCAEPGVLFIDRINHLNNLWYREHLSATNPCGEIPLPPYGACDLGSINLTQFVRDPFTANARFDHDALREIAAVAVRFLDNVIDLSRFPLEAQRRQARGARRIGLGLTGLADTFLMLGLRYGSEESLRLAGRTMQDICHAAYRASIGLAREKGAFPFFDRDKHLEGAFVEVLPDDIRDGIARHGIRNSHLTAIAPTGTISLLANNISSALEPVFSSRFRRKVFDEAGRVREFDLTDYALALWERRVGQGLPPAFVDVEALTPEAHLDIQAVLQAHVDSAISKTINVPEDYPFSAFQQLYTRAFERGLKGCTTFRPNPVTGEVLKGAEASVEAPHCCAIEREAD